MRFELPARLILLCLIGSDFAAAISDALGFVSSGSFELSDKTSSSLFNETNLRSDTDCALRCQNLGCAAIVTNAIISNNNSSIFTCQMIVINDVSKAPGPSANNVKRVIGGGSGDRVWKVVDFDQQIVNKRWNLITLVFNNTNNGSTGAIQYVRLMNISGCYRIEVRGARGGTGFNGWDGGRGARMSGIFSLTIGTDLTIVVGQRGGDQNDVSTYNYYAGGGGGGGTFVYFTGNNSLLMSAGGGGGGIPGAQNVPGQISQNGSDSNPVSQWMGFGGSPGLAGIVNPAVPSSYYMGGPGAGWLTKCTVARKAGDDGLGGGSRADGWIGGDASYANSRATGGFGGGGGAGSSYGGSGGGGGYSGGGAGVNAGQAGGGGGSFCGGTSCEGTAGGNFDSDHGSVVIQSC